MDELTAALRELDVGKGWIDRALGDGELDRCHKLFDTKFILFSIAFYRMFLIEAFVFDPFMISLFQKPKRS
jgi:hypothetical protein